MARHTFSARSSLTYLGLGGLLASALQGCLFGSGSCTDADDEPEFSQHQTTVTIDGARADEALLPDGTVDCSIACFFAGGQVISCSNLHPIDTGAGGAGGGGATGGGGAGGAGGSVGGAGGNVGGAGGIDPDATFEVTCLVNSQNICEGRRHAAVDGFGPGAGPDEAAAWLARAARAEAASVCSFRALRDELVALGAPAELVAAASAAAADEVRHARAMRKLADAAGAHHAPAPAQRSIARGVYELALENAVEGCVHETFAALVAMHQAARAGDARVRETMSSIARDEVRHGELAWRIHAWACSRLEPAEVEQVHDAMRRAAAALAHPQAERMSPAVRDRLGLPAAARVAELADRLRAELWS
jgi:hypothetical protein